MEQIANQDLILEKIPFPDTSWESIGQFALTFNGYKVWGSFEKCAAIANAERDGSLTELRTCLFFEWQRWRHFGDDPDKEAMNYIRNVVKKIRDKVAAREFE